MEQTRKALHSGAVDVATIACTLHLKWPLKMALIELQLVSIKWTLRVEVAIACWSSNLGAVDRGALYCRIPHRA